MSYMLDQSCPPSEYKGVRTCEGTLSGRTYPPFRETPPKGSSVSMISYDPETADYVIVTSSRKTLPK